MTYQQASVGQPVTWDATFVRHHYEMDREYGSMMSGMYL